MKILKVAIKNINSLRMETVIDFTKAPIANSGLFAITGDTGAGKTTILDAVTLALYGKVHRNKDVKEVISFGSADCFAEVEFAATDGIYRGRWELWRSRGKSDGNLQGPKRELAKWIEKKHSFEIIAEKIAEVNQEVENVTGLDYDRFSRSVMLSQGDFAAFLKSGEKERSDLLERITGTEIYSQLSKAAYQRHKMEEARLNEFRKEIESLRILDEAELKTLKKELKTIEKSSKTVKKSLQEKQNQLKWLEKIEALEKREEAVKEELNKLEITKNEFKDELEKLHLHQKTVPFHTQLSKLDDWQENQNQAQEELTDLLAKLTEEQNREKVAKADLTGAREELKNLKSEFVEKSRLFDEVLKLDVGIAEKSEPLQKLKTQVRELENQQLKVQESLKILNRQLETNTSEYETIQKWLKDHQSLKKLSDDFPAIKLHYKTLRELWQQEKILEKELKSVQKELDQATKEKAKSQQKLAKAAANYQELKDTFAKKVPEEFAQSRSELLKKLSEEIEKLSAHNKNLQQLKILNNEYQNLMAELSGFEDQLENLRQEEMHINNQVMSSLEALDSLNQQLEFKQQVYEQQRMIANYEQDRAELEEGEPCPLCFSKTHPFREKAFKPFVDKAKQELDQVKAQQELIYQDHRKLLKRQNDLEIEIEALSGNELKALSGQVKKQFEKLLTYEEQIALIAPELSKTDFSLTRKSLLNRKIADFAHKIEERKKTRELLITIDSDLEKLEQNKQSLQNQVKDQELTIAKIEEKQKLKKEKLEDYQKQFKESTASLNKILKNYQLTFAVETGKESLEKLETQKAAFEQRQSRAQELKGEIDLQKQEQKQLSQLLSTQEKNSITLKKELGKKESVLNELMVQRKTLFSDLDPEAEKNRWQTKIENAENSLESAKTAWNEINLRLQTTQHSIAERKKLLATNEEKINKLLTQLEGELQKKGFENLEALRMAILTDEQVSEIEQKSKTLKEKEVETAQALKSTHLDLKTERSKKLTEEDAKALQAKAVDLEIEFQQLQQGIGAIKEKLDQNDKLKAEGQNLLQNIEQQRKEYNRWAKLNDIIGMADGKKFRVFAQGLTLKKLTQLANNHLRQLNGRYFIHKRSDEDLSLDIIDTFQADNIRSMNTLSGGESFLVSLALALGLSDLAGRNTSINSLFIDEGFGTLDESTLDMAISTLENLQSKGKTIGIISHVKELKERISTQIIVKKKASGFSEIEITG